MRVSAFKSPKKSELYLYVPQHQGVNTLPAELLVMFGQPEHVIDFELTPARKMPRVEAGELIEALTTKGYFLQMPPSEIEKISDMPAPPEKLDNIY
jgi:uncharacterized protein YcgL (UPF0745 family)